MIVSNVSIMAARKTDLRVDGMINHVRWQHEGGDIMMMTCNWFPITVLVPCLNFHSGASVSHFTVACSPRLGCHALRACPDG